MQSKNNLKKKWGRTKIWLLYVLKDTHMMTPTWAFRECLSKSKKKTTNCDHTTKHQVYVDYMPPMQPPLAQQRCHYSFRRALHLPLPSYHQLPLRTSSKSAQSAPSTSENAPNHITPPPRTTLSRARGPTPSLMGYQQNQSRNMALYDNPTLCSSRHQPLTHSPKIPTASTNTHCHDIQFFLLPLLVLLSFGNRPPINNHNVSQSQKTAPTSHAPVIEK